ncbi:MULTISPECIES: YiiX/YebB-like N1pC/P60 family cysteine hydrolase [Brevibacterium]|uniref:YiiX/YebB-like N1pC/P60 family cysteine hydrolase n=1 Tax=Brevibacterium TaxID=1696 RepID=UPI000681E6C5|nr:MULTISPECIES: YiiX/YebB-like N1pC/P60 family cysteine hydrolase [Brevibacterium]
MKTSQTKRNKAGSYAYNKLRGKKYSANFAVNKKTGSAKMNCSQLVWAAYKASVKIDLDGNGGLGVYPYNIKDSKHTHIYKTIK